MPQPKSTRLIGKGVTLRSQSKCIIMNVFKNISNENYEMPRKEIQERAAELCGISLNTLRRILTEEKNRR